MKTARGIIILVILLGMILSAFFANIAFAAEPQEIDINVDQDDLLDVVLTLGSTDSDVSNVETDLRSALIAKGVPSDKIKIQAVEASEVSAGNVSEGWKMYDHVTTGWNFTDYSYASVPAPEGNTGSPYKHIWVYDEGQQIIFYGYDSPAYKDFMFMPNDDSTKKTFMFTMNDDNINNHSMQGGGFLFNANISNLDQYALVDPFSSLGEEQSIVTTDALSAQTISGYALMLIKTASGSYPALYSYSNVPMTTFHSNNAMTLVASESTHILSGVHSIKIEVSGDTFKLWDTVGETTYTMEYTGLTDTGSYGFGPFAQYASHGCKRLSWFNFENLEMETTSAKRFSEVIREPEWRDESKRFIINAEDGAVSDFSDPEALGEILARLGNENIHYLGWGRDETDGNAFIQKNDGNGTFVDKDAAATDTYNEQINALAQYIYSEYVDGVVNNTEYLIYGKPSSLSITPESEQTNTADTDWPNGKWLIDQDETYYENPTGVVPYDNVPLSNLDISFTETGKYDIKYKGEIVKTVYVHRQPVAKFLVSVDGSSVDIDDRAYDPDFESDADKGIASTAWYYKETTASSWTSGKPTSLAADKEYIIKQVVTDKLGVKSDPYLRYVSTSTSEGASTPVAEFKVTPSPLRTYIVETVSYSDMSYDPNGEAITQELWKISLNGTEIYSSSSPKTDFTGAGAGTYKITLEVKNASGVWSEPVARYLTVVRDTTAPTAVCNTSSGTYNEPKIITVTFSDEDGGSGFSHRFAVLSTSATTPDDWGSMGTNAEYSVAINDLGTYYLHYKAVDYASNETEAAYFGPFTLTDNTGPSAPDINTSPEYADGTWATESIEVSASGSTDDFTADENIIYEYSTDGVNYNSGRSITFDSTGVHTAYFRVTDEYGNSTVTNKTIKVDVSMPTVPNITMESDSETYTAGTWATADVDITLSGTTDGGSGLEVYQYKIDDGSWQDGSTYTFDASGKYTFYYRSKDNAGNVSATSSKAVWVDVVAPSEPTITTDPEYVNDTWATESIEVSASGSTDDMTAGANLTYEYSTDGVNYNSGSTITFDATGVHTAYFRVTDEAGNSTVVNKTVKVDVSLPTVPNITMESDSETYTAGTWATANVDITLSDSTDGGSGLEVYQYKIDDGSWQDGSTYTFNSSGKYTFYYRSRDNAGNVSATSSEEVWVDLEAPSEPTITTDPAYVNDTWATESIEVSASGSTDDMTAGENLTYEVSTDGTIYINGDNITLYTTGVYTVYFKVTDEAGNSTVVNKTVKVDVSLPTVPDITMETGSETYTAGTWTTADVDITLNGSTDAGSGLAGYQYKIDDGSWQDGSTYTFDASGKYTFYYRSKDNAGNVSETNSKAVWVDLQAPSEPMVTTAPEYTDGTWTNFVTMVSASGSTDDMTTGENLTYAVSIGGTIYSGGSIITLTTTGVHTVYFKVTDEAGNSTVVRKTVKVDLINPTTADIAMESDSEAYTAGTWATADVDITLSGASDEDSGVAGYQYKIDSGEWQDGSTYTFDTSGEYMFYYRSKDNAGNVSSTLSKSVKLDKEQPEEFSISTSVTTIDSIDISASTTDEMSGMQILAYRVHNGTEWSEWKAQVNETLNGYTRGQEIEIKVEAIDIAGNVRTATVTVSTLENTDPTAENDLFTMREDASYTVLDLTGNDTDADIDTDEGDSLTVVSVSELSKPSAGRLTLTAGQVTFKPSANYNGRVSFSYVVEDEFGAQSTGLAAITVTAVNDAPIAYNDSITTDEDVSTVVYVLKNDEDIDSTIEIKTFGNPSHGTVTTSGLGLKYTPDEDFNGKDTFIYTITDGRYESSASVTVTVKSVNDEPVLQNDKASTLFEMSVMIDVLANDSDIETDELVISGVSQPGSGIAVVTGGKVVYSPDEDFVGTDTFTYTVTDEHIKKTATVTVEVSYPEYFTQGTTIFELKGSGGPGGTGGGDEGDGEGNGSGGSGGENDGEIIITKQPTKGNTNSTGNNVYYTPKPGEGGMDTYSFVMKKNGEEISYQVLTMTDPVTGEAQTLGYGTPMQDDSFNTSKNSELVIDLSEYIENVDDITEITIDGQPMNGSVRIEDGKLIYTPDSDFTGLDGMVLTISMGDEKTPLAATFNVMDDEMKKPLFSWWCVLGWFIAGVLLVLNYIRHREFYSEKMIRGILYIVISVIVLLIMCWLRNYLGYIISAVVVAAYIAANYIYAWLRTRNEEEQEL